MQMRRIIVAVLAVAAVTVSACSASEEQTSSTTTSDVSVVAGTPDGKSSAGSSGGSDTKLNPPSVADAVTLDLVPEENLPDWIDDFTRGSVEDPENTFTSLSCDMKRGYMGTFANLDNPSAVTNNGGSYQPWPGAEQSSFAASGGIYLELNDRIPEGAIVEYISGYSSGDDTYYVAVEFDKSHNSYVVPWSLIGGPPDGDANDFMVHVFTCVSR
jgi:hypothetical protein